jgi:hypothetical protein
LQPSTHTTSDSPASHAVGNGYCSRSRWITRTTPNNARATAATFGPFPPHPAPVTRHRRTNRRDTARCCHAAPRYRQVRPDRYPRPRPALVAQGYRATFLSHRPLALDTLTTLGVLGNRGRRVGADGLHLCSMDRPRRSRSLRSGVTLARPKLVWPAEGLRAPRPIAGRSSAAHAAGRGNDVAAF